MKKGFKKTKDKSTSGERPHSHPPHPLGALCLYGIDQVNCSVVIRPRRIVPTGRQTRPPHRPVPAVGATGRRTYTRKRSKRRVTQSARHRPRPYLAAAYDPTAAFLRQILSEPL